MHITLFLQPHLLWALIISISAVSCTADQNEAKEDLSIPRIEREVEAQNNPAPQFEEVLPDSGLMENINPEEIITDDWTSDSPEAEADEN